MSSLALLGFQVVTGAALTWLSYKSAKLIYKHGKSKYLKHKEKRQSIPKLTAGKVEKFCKGKQQKQKVSKNRAKLLKEQIKAIREGSQVKVVSNRKNVNKNDVHEQVQNDKAVEEEQIKAMVRHNFNSCNENCNCCHAVEHTTEQVQNDESVEKELIRTMVIQNSNGSNENCYCHATEPIENDETMDLKEDIIKSMVMNNFSGCNNNCTCYHEIERTTDSGVSISNDLPKITNLPETWSEENEDGDDDVLDTTSRFTSIKSRDSSIASESIHEESITGFKNAAPDFEMFQNSTPIAFPSKKCEFDLSFKIPKLKLPTGKKRKVASAIERPTELPSSSSVTSSGGQHQDRQISMEQTGNKNTFIDNLIQARSINIDGQKRKPALKANLPGLYDSGDEEHGDEQEVEKEGSMHPRKEMSPSSKDSLLCSICKELCKRGVATPCCNAKACRYCAVKNLTELVSNVARKCWNCGKSPLATLELITDQDLRAEVQRFIVAEIGRK